MALSNSERQTRHRERMKDAALGRALIVLNVKSDAFSEFSPLPPRYFPFVPALGDEIELTFQGSLLTATVSARRIIEPDTSSESVVVDCIGSWTHDVEPYAKPPKRKIAPPFNVGDRVKHHVFGVGSVVGPVTAMVGPDPAQPGGIRDAGWTIGIEWDDENRGESQVADRALKMVHRATDSR